MRELVAEAVEAAASLIGRDEVARQWDQPSALAGMTVGALAAHLAASSSWPAAASSADTTLMRSWMGESMAAWK